VVRSGTQRLDFIPGHDHTGHVSTTTTNVVECQSALYRRHRQAPLEADVMTAATERLRAIVAHADTVSPTDEVRRRAARLVSVHPLQAADALQLAAALIWCEEQPHGEAFVCLDARLRDAAHREGFDIRPPELREN